MSLNLWRGDETPLVELERAGDADELCRLLLTSDWGWGSSARPGEAVDLLNQVHGTGSLPDSLIALLLCTCRRWHRVTPKLIAGIVESGLLSEDDLNELAETLICQEINIVHPLGLVWQGGSSEEGEDGVIVKIPVDDTAASDNAGREDTEDVVVNGDTIVTSRRHAQPPLRRWAAERVLRGGPGRLDDLLAGVDGFEPRHGNAFVHGLLDGADAISDLDERRRLVNRGLRGTGAAVRRAALDRLYELDGAAIARRRAAADSNQRVRDWRPPTPQLPI